MGVRANGRPLQPAGWSGSWRGMAVVGVGIGAATLVPLPAMAQDFVKDARAALGDLPTWKIPDICAKDSAQSHCLALESRAWRTVSGSWVSLPDAVKKLCLGNARSPSDHSWRVLNDCIDEAMEKNVDTKAVATRYTPAEPVPPARVAAAPATVPPTPAPAPPPQTAAATPPPAVLPPLMPLSPLVVTPPPAPQTPASVTLPPPVLGMPTAPPPFALDAEAEARRKAEADAAEARRRAEAEAAARQAAIDAEARRKAEADAQARASAAAAAQKCQDEFQAIARDGIIRFRFASAALDAQSQPTIARLAAAMKACPNVAVLVEGHTDAVGQDDANQKLSSDRAQAVADQLVRAGVDAAQIRAEGFGKSRPIADNATAEGRALNRRIEFKAAPR